MRLVNKRHFAVRAVASTDETRYILNGVRVEEIEIDGKPGVRMVATNGRALAMVEGITPSPEEFPAMAEVTAAPNGETSAVIPLPSVDKMMKAIPTIGRAVRLPILGNGVLKLSKTEATLIATNLENKFIIPTRVIEGIYPQYTQVIPTKEPMATVSLDPILLATLVKAAADATDRDLVTLHIYGERDAVKITAEGNDNKFTGVIMPKKAK